MRLGRHVKKTFRFNRLSTHREGASGKLELLLAGVERMAVGALEGRFETAEEADAVGELDSKAGAGVDLDHEGAAVLIDHHIDAEVAEAGHLVAGDGDVEDGIPVRELDADDGGFQVGVALDGVAVMHGADCKSGGEVNADADGTLVEVGAAIGFTGGGAEHGHDRIAAEHHHANVGGALETDLREDLGRVDAIFDEGDIAPAAEAEEAGEDVRAVVLQFIEAEAVAAGLDEPFALAGDDHDDPLPSRATGRLDHERLPLFQEAIEHGGIVRAADDTVGFRHGHVMLDGELLGAELVVDQVVEAARVVRQQETGVAHVDADHAHRPEFAGRADPVVPPAFHRASLKSRKRKSSDRR